MAARLLLSRKWFTDGRETRREALAAFLRGHRRGAGRRAGRRAAACTKADCCLHPECCVQGRVSAAWVGSNCFWGGGMRPGWMLGLRRWALAVGLLAVPAPLWLCLSCLPPLAVGSNRFSGARDVKTQNSRREVIAKGRFGLRAPDPALAAPSPACPAFFPSRLRSPLGALQTDH